MKNNALRQLVLIITLHGYGRLASAAEWQWSVPVPSLEHPNEKSLAFLWIPPDCKQVRGVVFAQHNMQEQPILEHSAFRKALSELGFAEGAPIRYYVLSGPAEVIENKLTLLPIPPHTKFPVQVRVVVSRAGDAGVFDHSPRLTDMNFRSGDKQAATIRPHTTHSTIGE